MRSEVKQHRELYQASDNGSGSQTVWRPPASSGAKEGVPHDSSAAVGEKKDAVDEAVREPMPRRRHEI